MNFQIKELLHGEPHFVDPVPQTFLCMLCKNIMINATYIPCGCEFCKECLENYFENKEKLCPCKDEIHPSNESKFDFQRDSVRSHPTNLKILRLKLKCKNCEKVKSIEEMSKHIDECNSENCKCVFKNFGCDKGVNLNDLSIHMIDDIATHNQILLDLINNLINEQYTINNTMKKQIDENHQLKDEMRICRAEIDNIKEENRQLKYQNEVLESRMQQMTEQMDKINTDQQSSSNNINQDEENILTNIRNMVSKLNHFYSKSKKYNQVILKELKLINQYTWTIDDFVNKCSQNLDLVSDSFFTHRFGYRIRLNFDTEYPSRDNFSIGFQIMKGKFDDGLPWPMRRKTGEDSDIEHIFEVDDFESCFKKPSNEDNETCYESFNYNKIFKGRYRHVENPLIKKDKIIIKCVTYPPDFDDSEHESEDDDESCNGFTYDSLFASFFT